MTHVTLGRLRFRFIIEQQPDGLWTWTLFDGVNKPLLQGPARHNDKSKCILEIEEFQGEVLGAGQETYPIKKS